MTSYANASSETSNTNSNSNMQRNRKTQALTALLSATALGVFLEGCGGGDTVAPPPPPPLVFGSQSNPFLARGDAYTFAGSEGADWVSYAESTLGVEVELTDAAAIVGEGAAGGTLTGIQNIIGTAQADTLTGNGQANTLRGGAGDDILSGNDGNDALYGGAGGDTINGGVGNDTIDGGLGNDIIDGGAGVDTLTGGEGLDTLTGGAGLDTLTGGAGADTYIFRVGDGADTIAETVEAAGASIINLRFINSDLGNYEAADFKSDDANPARFNKVGDSLVISIDKNPDDDILDQVTIEDAYNTDGNLRYTINVEYGAEGGSFTEIAADVAYWNSRGSQSRPFVPTTGADTFTGSEGADWVSYEGSDAVEITLNDDAAVAAGVGGAAEGDTLTSIRNIIGTAQGDTLTGNDKANILRGGEGVDTIDGGAGSDIIEGGVGVDILDGGTDTGAVAGADTSKDTLSYANEEHSADLGVVVNLATSTSFDYATTTTRDTISNFENVIGSRYADTLTGDAQANILAGGAGGDELRGNAGDDTLNGEAGVDTLYGGDDNDILSGGDDGDTLNGGAGGDTLNGGVGDDIIHGGAGVDTLNGEGGTDSYIFNAGDGADTIEIDTDGGRLLFKAATSLGSFSFERDSDNNVKITVGEDSVEILAAAYADGRYALHYDADDKPLGALIVSAGGTLTGSSEGDVIIGTAQADTINGGGGGDRIAGGVGADTLNGGAGSDTISGGAGADTYIFRVGDGADTISDGEGDTINLRFIGAYEATDFAATSNNFNKVGNNLEITIDKDTANNNPIIDKVTINDAYNSEGELRFTIDVEYGVDLSNLYAVLGIESNPFLATNAADTFTGLAAIGADWVSYAYEGFTPFTTTGGKVVGVYFDLNTESGNPAFVQWASADDSLTDINNFIGTEYQDTFTGTGADNIFHGNGGDDRLQGYSGDDMLYGGAGNDEIFGQYNNNIIDGGAGADTLIGGTGIDTFIFRVGDGTDIITDTIGNTMTLRFIGSLYEADDFKSGDGYTALFTRFNDGDNDKDDLVIAIDKDTANNNPITDQVTIKDAYNTDSEIQYTINVEYGTEGSLTEVTADYWSDLT